MREIAKIPYAHCRDRSRKDKSERRETFSMGYPIPALHRNLALKKTIKSG